MTLPQPRPPENRPTRAGVRYPLPCPPDEVDPLRHRSGGTYLIGGRPDDPHDPCPWPWRPAPEYRHDTRTGRHRRGELPDPRPQRHLREEAFARFLSSSEEFARSHIVRRGRGRFAEAVFDVASAVRTALFSGAEEIGRSSAACKATAAPIL